VGEPAGLWILGSILVAAGVALAVVGRKQQAGTLRRNWLAGLRTWETMRSDAAWNAAHSATAGLVTASGVVQILAGGALLVLQPSDEGSIAAIVLGGAAATLGLVVTAV
jgi:hypothetical protein